VLDFRRLSSKFRVWVGYADVHLCVCVFVRTARVTVVRGMQIFGSASNHQL